MIDKASTSSHVSTERSSALRPEQHAGHGSIAARRHCIIVLPHTASSVLDGRTVGSSRSRRPPLPDPPSLINALACLTVSVSTRAATPHLSFSCPRIESVALLSSGVLSAPFGGAPLLAPKGGITRARSVPNTTKYRLQRTATCPSQLPMPCLARAGVAFAISCDRAQGTVRHAQRRALQQMFII